MFHKELIFKSKFMLSWLTTKETKEVLDHSQKTKFEPQLTHLWLQKNFLIFSSISWFQLLFLRFLENQDLCWWHINWWPIVGDKTFLGLGPNHWVSKGLGMAKATLMLVTNRGDKWWWLMLETLQYGIVNTAGHQYQ